MSTPGAPAIVSSSSIPNGPPNAGDHNRRTSSVTISAQGTPPFGPNGNAAASKNIAFGQMAGSPAIANSVPHLNNATLTPQGASKTTTRTPSPIANPPVSGGRPPPSGPQGARDFTFGNLPGAEGGDQTVSIMSNFYDHTDDFKLRQPLPQGPAHPDHVRRGSQASAHGEMPRLGPHAGRGRGFQQQYPNNMGHSPQVPFRTPNMPQRNLANVTPFQSQAAMRGGNPNSPYQANRTPVVPAAAMAPQPHMANGPPMGHQYYQHNMNPNVNRPPFHKKKQFDTFTSHRRQKGGDDSRSADFVDSGYYSQPLVTFSYPAVPDQDGDQIIDPDLDLSKHANQFLTHIKATNMYGMQNYGNMYDPYYQQQQYMQQMQPGMPHMGYSNAAPPSPRNFPSAHSSQPFMPTPYTPPATQMGRTPSHAGSDRPSSVVQQNASTPLIQSSVPVSTSPAPSATTQRPKKSAAIVIKNSAGEVVDLKSMATQGAAKSSGPPLIVSDGGVPSTSTPSAPTPPPTQPPPRAATSTPQPVKVEEKSEKELLDTKRAFKEQVQKQLEQKAKSTDGKTEEPIQAEKTEEPAVEAKEAEKPAEDEESEMDRMIREMEEQDRMEEERQKVFEEKRKLQKAEEAKKAAATADEDLRRQEREAEELEEKKLKEASGEKSTEQAENEKLFASLKKATIGPGAAESGASTPEMPPPAQLVSTPKQTLPVRGGKPDGLTVDTKKPAEPAQPTPGMRSLSNARVINFQTDNITYPDGIESPNPALNQGAKTKGRQYDQKFLLQFQTVFKERPNIGWDKILKDTVGDGSSDSARPQSARTPSMSRGPSSRGVSQVPSIQMGSFSANGRTLPPGTTSEARFAASQGSGRQSSTFGAQPIGQFMNRPGMPFPMAPAMSRTGSASSRGPQANSPRTGSTRNPSKRDKFQEEKAAKSMPLTQGLEIKTLEVSKTGWKPTSIGVASKMANTTPDGMMSPDVVQRKVKSALNKMTPNNFEKISMEILVISGQSAREADGRTLRQVIQLTFEKACDESHWSGMYADFCMKMLKSMSDDIKDENVKDKTGNPVTGGSLFRKYLLNRCQEDFERGWESNVPALPEGGGSKQLTEEYYIAAAAKRKGLGLIQFIGELYKLGMLNIRIMHECVLKLLDYKELPDESNVESLVRLLRTIGIVMEDDPKNGKNLLNSYFERVDSIMKIDGLPSRMYFMLLDIVDLRRNRWDSKDADKGPKTIAEIHAEAAQKQMEIERRAAASRSNRPPMGRGDSRSMSGQFMPPPDHSRTTVNVDDLRRLTRGSGRASGAGGSSTSLGPQSLLSSSRNNSRRGLGPNSRGAEDSAGTSRTNTPPVRETSANAFS
jgi:translation initiation factor 4G